MLDVCLLAFFAVFLALGLRKPFLWVLVYLYVDIVAPQKIGWTLLPSIPISLIAFAAAFGGWALMDRKDGARFTFRQGVLLALLIYCGLTTLAAQFPLEALEKWAWVWKALLFAIFLPLALTTRLRIEAAALVMVLSVATIIINGGIKTVFAGGGYATLSLLVRENSGLYEGSIISTVAIAVIPLIFWLTRWGTIYPPSKWVTMFAVALCFACLLIPVGTAARTGLICIAFLGVLILRTSRHKFLFASLGAFALVASVPFLPKTYLERMSTITQPSGDESASTRMAVWRWTLDYVKANPMGGGFDAYRGNSFTYKTRAEVDKGGGRKKVESFEVTDKARAYHSAYFEMLGEQGYPGLALWLLFHGLGILQMERVRRLFRKSDDADDRSLGELASALQQGHLVYLVGALFVGIAFQPFVYMFAALEIGLASFVWRQQKERQAALPRRRPGMSRNTPAPDTAENLA